MSLVAHRRHRPGKRSFEDEGSEEQRGAQSTSKARRLITSVRRSAAAGPAHVPVTPSVISGLRSLYPAMNEQVITAVLSDCGSDIDAAIRKLGQLQLQAERTTTEGTPQASPRQQPAPTSPGATSPAPLSGAGGLSPRQSVTAAAAGGNTGAARPPQPQSQSAAQPQPPQQAPPPPPPPPPQAQAQQPRTPEEWVEALVASMQQATDVGDARARAAQALQAFEQAVQGSMQAPQATAPDSQQQVAVLQRDNGILKRAVAIQNNRLQDLAGAAQQIAAKDVELAELRVVAKQCHDRVQALELSNFSLAQHLRQATDARSIDSSGRHVF